MSRVSYIKPTSAVRQNAERLRGIVTETLRITSVTAEERNAVMFEIGCAFVEKYIPSTRWQQQILHNSQFWNWWTVEFTEDDGLLINEPDTLRTKVLCEVAKYNYRNFKIGMLDDKFLEQNFRYMPETETINFKE